MDGIAINIKYYIIFIINISINKFPKGSIKSQNIILYKIKSQIMCDKVNNQEGNSPD